MEEIASVVIRVVNRRKSVIIYIYKRNSSYKKNRCPILLFVLKKKQQELHINEKSIIGLQLYFTLYKL